ncbi:uncharacterized protein LOC133926089 isoform X2 [Phragmites australis]|uniref:uncharacterized protein LOC133926089 isoform X2 n=1 Tax=Phragmites australis TaxID=29695 RepID=UPI002D77300B|nr:uncharacterized protein LOC133926089 isoform X2 [Phragmites australis]XP_062227833.1 uncharacterized protein LOC133926089 isoform X2 [Phragmites australis]
MSSEPPEPKKMRIVYSRDFLLSFGELEHCKKLPPGFDTALLSELQELSAGVLERNKGYYNTPLGRSDGPGGYSYSSRGGNSGGRWDTRSSGSSDRDGELPDREPLTQGRNVIQYRRNWQNTEHDGLLGSGGFPRPSGYASAGQLASKDHGTAYQLNRTSQRYQPPRPYKKDVDSMNDETFGSSECSNEDRAEEERKRRASFEMMRKEQHKAMQGKNGPDILKENPSDDIMSQLQTSTEKANANTKNEKLDGSAVSSIYQENTTKTSSVLPAPAARPLVPPGFANAFVEKKLQSQSSKISLEPKGHNATTEANMATIARFGDQLEGNQSATEITACESKEKGIFDNIASMGQNHTVPSGGVTTSTEFASSILKGSEDWEANVTDKCSFEKGDKSKNIDPVRKDSSVSILEQFFGNALLNSGSNLPTYVESQPVKSDDENIASVTESSKFACWFLDEDSKPAEDLSSKSLLSMIVKNENPGPENITHAPLPDGAVQNLSPRSPIGKLDSASKLLSFTSPTPADGILEQFDHSNIPETVPVMMTCEDLEQTMLAQVKSKSSLTQKNAILEHQIVVDEPVAMQKVAVDDHASHHLLSLLQKGTDSKGSSSLGFQIGSADELLSVDTNLMDNGAISGSDPVNKAENVPTSGKNLTLEALFGAAFMNELHSKDAPVSIRGSTTGGPNEFVETGKTLLSSGHEVYYAVEPTLPFNNINAAVPKETGIEYMNSALPGPNQGNASFDKKGFEIQLPEEDNLFTMNDSLPGQNSDFLPSVKSSRIEGLLPQKAVDDISYRLQSLVPGDAEHIQVLGPDALGSHSREQRYQVESQNLYHLLQGRPPMMAPRPMMDHIVNRNQQAPFDMPQPIRHDIHRSFPTNVNPMQHALHAPGVPHLDPAAHHLMLQHISMPGSFPPEGLPRGVLPSQPVHHMPGYRPEMSNVNNFHMHPRQPSYGEFGLMPGPSGPEVRGDHPEAFERFIQMEMSARSKQQVHPAMAGPVPGGLYGHELDMNLRYR